MTEVITNLPQNSNDKTIQILTRLNYGLWCLLVLAGLFIGLKFSISIAVGGTIAIVNFYWLRRQLMGLLAMSPRAATTMSQLRAISRLAIWGFVLYLALVYGKLNPVGLLLGLSILILNIFILTGIMLFRKGGHT